MSELKFYTKEDLQLIHDNLDQIEVSAAKEGFKILDPKNEEYSFVNSIIIDFIIEKNRIVYGGSAYHKIIEHYRKDKGTDGKKIYPEWDRYDIEFYTPTPIADLVAICNRLYNAKVKYVIGRQAQHNETFTIFANFLQYCDMSYMSSNIYNKIDTITIDSVRYIHPDLILIDIFRMYNDPLTSYWRLSKVFKRMQLLMDKFPFEFNKAKAIEFKSTDDNNKIIEYILPKLINEFNKDIDPKFLFVGELAYLIYTNPDETINTTNKLSQLEIVTDNLNAIFEYIEELTYTWAEKHTKFENYSTFFKVKKYSRFFQYWDKRTIIFYNDKPLITIIGSNNRCIPVLKSKISSKLEINIGTFLVVFNYFFIGHYYEKINNKGFYFGSRDYINSLLTIRNKYLESKNKTVLDNTIYKEFVIDCIGQTMEFSREFLLELNKKREQGIKGIFSYDPNTSIGTSVPNIEFEQSDGLELI